MTAHWVPRHQISESSSRRHEAGVCEISILAAPSTPHWRRGGIFDRSKSAVLKISSVVVFGGCLLSYVLRGGALGLRQPSRNPHPLRGGCGRLRPRWSDGCRTVAPQLLRQLRVVAAVACGKSATVATAVAVGVRNRLCNCHFAFLNGCAFSYSPEHGNHLIDHIKSPLHATHSVAINSRRYLLIRARLWLSSAPVSMSPSRVHSASHSAFVTHTRPPACCLVLPHGDAVASTSAA